MTSEKEIEIDLYNLASDAVTNQILEKCADLSECANITSIYPAQPRVIALGDIHGDLEALLICLADLAKVITYKRDGMKISYNWIGGNTYVVIVGDTVDRKRVDSIVDDRGYLVGEIDDEEEIILNLINLISLEAEKDGGKIIKLLGNHEVLNLYGYHNYVTDVVMKNENKRKERIEKTKPGGLMAKQIIGCGTLGLVKIGDWVFVHGGILPGIIHTVKKMRKYKQLIENEHTFINDANKLARKIFLRKLHKDTEQLELELAKIYFITNDLDKNKNKNKSHDSEIKELYTKRDSLLTERRLSIDSYGGIRVSRNELCTALQTAFKLLGYSDTNTNIVVAHTVQLERGLQRRSNSNPGYISGYSYNTKITEDNDRIIYGGPGERYDNPVGNTIDEIYPHAINYECPSNNSNCGGQIWRIDIGMSRGFDTNQLKLIDPKLLEKMLEKRKPMVLEILYDAKNNHYDTHVIVSKKPLSRPWLQNTE